MTLGSSLADLARARGEGGGAGPGLVQQVRVRCRRVIDAELLLIAAQVGQNTPCGRYWPVSLSLLG